MRKIKVTPVAGVKFPKSGGVEYGWHGKSREYRIRKAGLAGMLATLKRIFNSRKGM